ncbi:hypothetical protein PIB30_083070 [Stylosanthes scabra]|uniref:Uncharacterized protein n=1 Tax=Stylosanthes scabra TaxID=79078 RepID=A0ABU6QTF5_9FABA|nr:hypothetical protein [Stylosanthes scabra]
MEDISRESRLYSSRIYPRLRSAWFRVMNCFLCYNTRLGSRNEYSKSVAVEMKARFKEAVIVGYLEDCIGGNGYL